MNKQELDLMVENFLKPQPKKRSEMSLDGLISIINEVIESNTKTRILNEAALSTAELSKIKYFVPFLDKIQQGQPLLLEPASPDEEPQPFTVDTESDAGKKLVQALVDLSMTKDTSTPEEFKSKLEAIFGKRATPVIPSTDGNMYKINQLSKSTFTAKITKGGLQGTETPDMKEGLVAYFFLVGTSGLTKAEEKLESKSDTVLDLPIQIIDPVYFGRKSASLVRNAVTYLNENQIKDKKEIGLYLNAISAAKTCLTYSRNVVDRGDLFEAIRRVASQITNIEPDKWCPGDVYLYDAASREQIVKVVEQVSENKNIVSIVEGGEVRQIGLNHLFEGENPIIHAISLKEEEALSGRATAFLSIKNMQGEELSSQTFEFTSEEIQILKSYKDRKIANVDTLIAKYKQEYDTNKEGFKNAISSYGVQIAEGVSKKKLKVKSPEQEVGNLVSKSTCFRFMTTYLNDFENLKQANEVMVKYDNPMLALTAFGVSLSGFNPTFKKVIAFSDGEPADVTIFKGRDSLSIASNEASLFDTPTKAGFNFSFITMMGEKKYKTTLDIRFAGGVNISIIVQEFHEE